MKILYADESGSTGTDYDNKEQPIFVLGGFLVDDSNWHEINKTFNKEKIKICKYFKDNEIHATNIFSPPHKSYFHARDWKDNLLLLENLVDLIVSLNISFQYIVIDKKSFKINMQNYFGKYLKIDPYVYSFCMLYDKISKNLNSSNEKGLIFLDDIISIPKHLKDIYPEISFNNNFFIEKALFLNSSDTNFIQIADIYSFYICKYFSIINGYKKYSDIKHVHCINMYRKLMSKTNISTSEILTSYFPEKYFK